MKNFVLRTLRAGRSDRRGTTPMEYAMICSMVTLAIVIGLQTYGAHMSRGFTQIASAM